MNEERSKQEYPSRIQSISQLKGEEKAEAHMRWDFANSKRIRMESYLAIMLGCGKQ